MPHAGHQAVQRHRSVSGIRLAGLIVGAQGAVGSLVLADVMGELFALGEQVRRGLVQFVNDGQE